MCLRCIVWIVILNSIEDAGVGLMVRLVADSWHPIGSSWLLLLLVIARSPNQERGLVSLRWCGEDCYMSCGYKLRRNLFVCICANPQWNTINLLCYILILVNFTPLLLLWVSYIGV